MNINKCTTCKQPIPTPGWKLFRTAWNITTVFTPLAWFTTHAPTSPAAWLAYPGLALFAWAIVLLFVRGVTGEPK